jgi:hypothetical protein
MPKPVKFKTELVKSDSGSGWHFILVEEKIAKRLAFTDKFRRVICSINKGEPFQCALMPWGDKYFIIVNKTKRDAVGIVEGDVVSVVLERDESRYGLPMPEELREVMNQDPEGDKLFHALTAGKQRSMLYFIGQIKDIDKRIHAALVLMEHLKENDGKIIDSKLSQEWKRPIW